MENTKIEWAQHTFSPWHGCAKVSPGCKNCYADAQHNFHYSSLKSQQGTCWGVNAPRLAVSADTWKKPLKWNRDAQAAGVRARVFCASMADVFEGQSAGSRLFIGETAQVPTGPGKTRTVRFVDMAVERLRLLRLIYDTPHLDWLLLTKRPENIVPALHSAYQASMPGNSESSGLLYFSHWLGQWAEGKQVPANVWLGTSVENQEQADIRVPHLLAAPAAVRFLSCEPLLGPVDLTWLLVASGMCYRNALTGTQQNGPADNFIQLDGLLKIDWVIVGGESGPHARPLHPLWAESLRDQCQAAGVAFHFKQWGEYEHFCMTLATEPTGEPTKFFVFPDGYAMRRVGKHEAGRLLDGRTWDEVPTPQPVAP